MPSGYLVCVKHFVTKHGKTNVIKYKKVKNGNFLEKIGTEVVAKKQIARHFSWSRMLETIGIYQTLLS